MSNLKDFSEKLKPKIQSVPESKYSIPIYIVTIFSVLIWTYLLNWKGYLCISAIFQGTIALLVPLAFFREKNIKKIVVVGIISLFILFSAFSAYNVHQRYNMSTQELESKNLKNGTVNKLYGESGDEFNFTVTVLYQENMSQKFSVYVNLSYTQFSADSSEHHEETYKLKQTNNGKEYYRSIILKERQYRHHFVLKDNTTSNGSVNWEETELGRGPNTVPKSATFFAVFILQTPYPIFIFLLLVGILWWKKRMNKSKETSTEGLEEKEKQLDDYCEECGAFLEGKKVCTNCGHEIKSENEEKEDTQKFIEKRVKCKSCGRIVSRKKESCPYCGSDIKKG